MRLGSRVLATLLAAWGLAGPVAAQPAAGSAFLERCQMARTEGALVRVLHFGDSHLAAPAASRSYGGFFRGAYGDGGPGLGLPWVLAMDGVKAEASRGWRRPERRDNDRLLGLGGSYLEASRPGEWARLEGTFSRVRIHFLRCAGGGRATIRLDGAVLGEVELSGEESALQTFERPLGEPARSHRLEILCQEGGRVRILGVALERASGVSHSVLAYNGAEASWMSQVPEELFGAELRAEAPDLVLLAFGTNEANAVDFEPAVYQAGLEALVARFRKAVPRAALVLVGPPDALLKRARPGALEQVIQVQRTVTEKRGLAFVDRRRAMGGSIAAWRQEGLAGPDLVHLTGTGYVRLARATLLGLWPQAPLEPELVAPVVAGAGPSVPMAPAPSGSRILVFRTRDGRVFITDDPNKVKDLEGEWVQENP